MESIKTASPFANKKPSTALGKGLRRKLPRPFLGLIFKGWGLCPQPFLKVFLAPVYKKGSMTA